MANVVEKLYRTGLALTAAVSIGCASPDMRGQTSPTPTKPVAAAGVPPKLTPVLITTQETPSAQGYRITRVLIGYDNTTTEEEKDKFDAEFVLWQIFNPRFLTAEIKGDLELEPIHADNPYLLNSPSNLRGRFQTINKPGSKIEAKVIATFRDHGLDTATIKGRVNRTLPWADPFAAVKPGEVEKVVTALEDVFSLAQGTESVHVFPGRNLPGSNEIVDVFIGISRDGELTEGRKTQLWVNPNGEFRYSISGKP